VKIICDTNVLVSGIFFKGPPYKILEYWRDGKCELIVSEEIFKEYTLVCERLHAKYHNIKIKEIIDFIAINAHFYQQIEINEPITKDRDDDKFIKCALASDVKIIISGDKHLLDVNGYKGIEVISPSGFIKKYL
jgi:putative PIN family toxin of toxin-antitoxin system